MYNITAAAASVAAASAADVALDEIPPFSGGLIKICKEVGREGPTYLPYVSLSLRIINDMGMRAPGSLMPIVAEALIQSFSYLDLTQEKSYTKAV